MSLVQLLEENNPNSLNPEDLEGFEPDRTLVRRGYDARIYQAEDVTLMIRDNSESVWVKRGDGDFRDDGVPIVERRAEVGQNTMGDVTTALRPYSPVTEPDGPNSYNGSFNHQDVFDDP